MSGRGRGNKNWRGGRGRGRGGRGGRPHFHRDKNQLQESSWKPKEEMSENGEVDIEFADYEGEKLHDLPAEFLAAFKSPEDVKKIDVAPPLTETAFGICNYLHPENEGFSGILKHRYSDFVVHEIDKDGNLVKLTDLELPKEAVVEPETLPDHSELPEDKQKVFSQLTWKRLVTLANKYADRGPTPSTDVDSVKINVTAKEKEDRTYLHQQIKEMFPFLNAETKSSENGSEKFIVVDYRPAPVKNNFWPRGRPKHLTFHLSKKDLDQAQALGMIARGLNMNHSKFCVAGTKDRRALTTQKVSVPFVTAEKLFRVVTEVRRVHVGNFSYERKPLDLGDLVGNHFKIVLRNLKGGSHEEIEKSLSNLRDEGFINYFGHQRFGTDPVIRTSDIGLALIRSEWEKAVELILRPRIGERPNMTRTRAHWWMYRKPQDALVLMGYAKDHCKSVEGQLLRSMASGHNKDLVGALNGLNKNSLLLYLHAYQSLIWNKVVSKRLSEHGTELLIGDLVIPEEAEEQEVTAEEAPAPPDSEGGDKEGGHRQSRIEKCESKVVVVTEENMNEFSVRDVVMPIPGYRARYPENEELKNYYLEALKEDGFDEGFEALKHKNPVYSLVGDYRHILAKPMDMTWRFVKHSDPDQDLVQSDFEILEGETLEIEEGDFESLIIELGLKSSTYATMALREAMKADLGKSSQRALTEDFKREVALKRKSEDGDNLEAEQNGTKKLKVDQDDVQEPTGDTTVSVQA